MYLIVVGEVLLEEGWYLLCVVCELEMWVCWVVFGWEVELIVVVDVMFFLVLLVEDVWVFMVVVE